MLDRKRCYDRYSLLSQATNRNLRFEMVGRLDPRRRWRTDPRQRGSRSRAQLPSAQRSRRAQEARIRGLILTISSSHFCVALPRAADPPRPRFERGYTAALGEAAADGRVAVCQAVCATICQVGRYRRAPQPGRLGVGVHYYVLDRSVDRNGLFWGKSQSDSHGCAFNSALATLQTIYAAGPTSAKRVPFAFSLLQSHDVGFAARLALRVQGGALPWLHEIMSASAWIQHASR